jgi:hypothetical protein
MREKLQASHETQLRHCEAGQIAVLQRRNDVETK